MEAGLLVVAIVLILIAIVGLYWFVNSKTRMNKKTIHGMLNIVYDEFSKDPQLMLALYDPVEEVVGQKRVLFEVNVIRQNSQK